MKTIDKIKLLKKLKEAIREGAIGEDGCGGLCGVIATIEYSILTDITNDEKIYLFSIIPKKRRPDDYCWEPYVKAPRIRFINKKIDQLKKRV